MCLSARRLYKLKCSRQRVYPNVSFIVLRKLVESRISRLSLTVSDSHLKLLPRSLMSVMLPYENSKTK